MLLCSDIKVISKIPDLRTEISLPHHNHILRYSKINSQLLTNLTH